jgi:hypothetical protein
VYLTTNELLERWHGGINDEKKYFNFGILVEGNPKYNLEKLVHMN